MKFYYVLFCGLVLFNMSDVFAQKTTPEAYIETYKDLAISEMKRSGIPASITLAQGMLESANGNSRLAVKANNHFGIKCHNEWNGKEIYHDDNKKGECFRHYKNAKESYIDHTDFLMSRSRYAFLFEYSSTDYKNWATGLRKAGYATDSKYPQLLINLIERYNLSQYDTGVSISAKTSSGNNKQPNKSATSKGKTASTGEFSIDIEKHPVKENNRTNYVQANAGDSYPSLAKELNMMPWQLPKYNEVPASAPLSEGQMVYLQPKRRKAERGNDVHVVQTGETMYDISQAYAIKLKRLYVLNRMDPDTQPEVGEKLNLRKKKRR